MLKRHSSWPGYALLVTSLLGCAAQPTTNEADPGCVDGKCDDSSSTLGDATYRGRAAIRFANTASDAELANADLSETELSTLTMWRNGADHRRSTSDDRMAATLADLWFLAPASLQRLADAAVATYASARSETDCDPTGWVDISPPDSAFLPGGGSRSTEQTEVDKTGTMFALRTTDSAEGGSLAMRSPSGTWINVPLPRPAHHSRQIVVWGADEWGVWIFYQVRRGGASDPEANFGAEFGFLTNWRGYWEDQVVAQPFKDCIEENTIKACTDMFGGYRTSDPFRANGAVSRGGVATIVVSISVRDFFGRSDPPYYQLFRAGTRKPVAMTMDPSSDWSDFAVCAHDDNTAYLVEDRRVGDNAAAMFIGTINTGTDQPEWNPRMLTRHVGSFSTYRGASCTSVDGNTIAAWTSDDAVNYIIANAAGTESQGTIASYVAAGSAEKSRKVALASHRGGFDVYYTSETSGTSKVARRHQAEAFPSSSSLALTAETIEPVLTSPIVAPAVLPTGARSYYAQDRLMLETCSP